MSNKSCKLCGIIKPLSGYYSGKGCKDGVWTTCKICTLEKQIKYNNNRKEIRRVQSGERYLKNKELILANNKKWHKNNPEKMREYARKNKEKPESKERIKKYYIDNKTKILEVGNLYSKNRRKVDYLYKMKIYLRNRIRFAFNNVGLKKNETTELLLGIDYKIARQYIENQFKPGMIWGNYGDWHIDHKIPLGLAKTEDELKTLCHYTNLQPMWAIENIKKGKKIINPIQMTIAI